MREIFLRLESENVEKRLQALDELEKQISTDDKKAVIKVLKEHILDWDEEVRAKVAHLLKIYMEK
ncbi:hypothetical protein WESB_1667 [Brachyspira pilosicoli WesB]|uniref:HEAT repeat domain-containing protein n=1 Tax=Brachyspira pilosicoli WesB TaxID=1161918 RepID=K0JJP6_BRAPL|nr:hypothetical protein [Brachyspira pilosicoli]CCG57132.1 hypothetical protein WESB_1667 [Brachyspira pilosicoli WesB]